MTLTRKDGAALAVAAWVVLVYVANTQDWWYLGSNRWAIATMTVGGVIGCSLGSAFPGKPTPMVGLLSALGVAALVLVVVGLVTGSHAMLLALTIVLLVLWLGTTLRHATGSHPRALPGV
jgi:hypothetical protein